MDNETFLDARELASRWGCHVQTLSRLRSRGEGPDFVKVKHPVRVLYRLTDVEKYEQANPHISFKSNGL